MSSAAEYRSRCADASRFGAKRGAPQRDGSSPRPSTPTSLPGSIGSPGAASIPRRPRARITWKLDGLEVTLVGAIGPVLQDATLRLSPERSGAASPMWSRGYRRDYLRLADRRVGPRLVFYVTLIVSVAAYSSRRHHRISRALPLPRITDPGIDDEYAAINSAIDELIWRACVASTSSSMAASRWALRRLGAWLLFLDPNLLAPNVGWQLEFGVGGILGLGILLLRHYVPESPRWLVTHGYNNDAEAVVGEIEKRISSQTGKAFEPPKGTLEVHPRKTFGLGLIIRSMFGKYRERSVLALTLMVAQAFLFNAVFFSYGLVLTTFDKVPEQKAGLYLLPLSVVIFLDRFCSDPSSIQWVAAP